MSAAIHPPLPDRPDLPTLIRMTRPGFLLITAVGVFLGTAMAATCGCTIQWPLAGAALALALLAHAGANVLNDYQDSLNGADAANEQGLFPFTGGSRLIQNRVVSAEQTRQWAWTLLVVVSLLGILMTAFVGPALLLIGLLGMGVAWAYSAKPLQLMSRGMGEITVGLAWWLVVLGAYVVQKRELNWVAATTAISYALLVMNILVINGLPDAASDARVGKATLVSRIGPDGACLLYGIIALLAHAWLAFWCWQWVIPMPAIWGLASLPLSATATALLWLRRHRVEALRPAIVLTIASAVVHGTGAGTAMLLQSP